ncbi:mechanosensitive ion channel family protein [Defluviitalea phaphyphila]|uniref:mechanosensitive ion channel family protein n=1 Tax=Defluviitalea phaphyphila TaxID=1473580 RepID=UPI000731DC24|nr:mechanosensitive ion channel domain-containing protein [Defluviitalea phaphyphila]
MKSIEELLSTYNLNNDNFKISSMIILILAIILIYIIANFITTRVLLSLLSKFVKQTKIKWDDYLLKRKFFRRLAKIIPGIITYLISPLFGPFQTLIEKIAIIYILSISILVVNSGIDALHDIYQTYPVSKQRPIKGIIQVFKIIFYIIMGIIIIAYLIDKDPIVLLSSIGALTAVFSLVFKDSILGLVAGIQLSANDMLRIGDWIEMPKYGADGDVIDISLNTVKVQNFDKTIVTIPSYALISDSFKNWRGMQEAGGRRIKRSIYIDINSIKLCSPQMLEKFKKINYLTNYIMEKEKEIQLYDESNKVDNELLINNTNITNLGIFRIYIENYLKNHPKVHKKMIHMVRQLPSGECGLPLELYFFVNDTNWINYENIQSDIFEHIFAIADIFELKIFQKPSSHDLRSYILK